MLWKPHSNNSIQRFLAVVVIFWGVSLCGINAPWAKRQFSPQGPTGPKIFITGQGAPQHTFVFLHGLGGAPQSALAHNLAQAFQRRGDRVKMIVPWLRPVKRGILGNIVDNGPHTMTDQLTRIRKIINNEPNHVTLLGHSFGGKAACVLLKEGNDKIDNYVCMAPSVSMLYSTWKRLTGQRGLPQDGERISNTLTQRSRALQQGIHQARRRGNEKLAENMQAEINFLKTMKDLVQYNEPALESQIRKPMLLMHGAQDESVSVHYVRRFAQNPNNTGIRYVEFPNADHHFMVWKPLGKTERPAAGDFIDPLTNLKLDRQATKQVADQMANQIMTFIGQQKH